MRTLRILLLATIALLSACGGEPKIENPPSKIDYIGTAALPPHFDAQGHRGARGLLPENTLPAFEAALDYGVTTLELDLHYTQDGHVVLWHDPIIDKAKCRLPEETTAAVPDPRNPLRRIFISQQSLETIQSYQCDQNPDSGRFPDQQALTMPLAGSDYRIVTLGELFDFVDNYVKSVDKSAEQVENAAAVHFNIETKRNPDHPEYIGDGFTGGEAGPFELAILEEVNTRGLTARVTIQSFDHRSLRTIREIDESIRLAALTTGGEAKVKVYYGYQFDIWSPNYNDLTLGLIEEAHELGLQVIPWTVNEPALMRALLDMGVDGIISDRPDILLTLETQE
ncbi:MAG: hypothetical protein KDE51_21535 [Anaerolineales bacterium]|nr:hypothetical protein [Anaerolineales bacterium]